MIDEKHNGEILIGGNYDIKEKYIEPTIIVKPSLDSKLMKEEIFGPILPVYFFEKIDEVIDFINKRPKPLALYYFGFKH